MPNKKTRKKDYVDPTKFRIKSS